MPRHSVPQKEDSMNLRRALGRLAGGLGALLGLAVAIVLVQVYRFEQARGRVYDVAAPTITISTEPAVLARGRHLAESLGGCHACHGDNLGGAPGDDMGPVGQMGAPNLTRGRGGVGSIYTDGQIARAVRHGIGSDDRTLIFMPSHEFSWWPQDDLTALVSYVRSVPPVDNEQVGASVGLLGKLLHQFGTMTLTTAELVDHHADPEDVPAPEPTARYGRFLARSCMGCHGERLSGGRIPGAPSSIPAPTNLTSHATGLATWTVDDFISLLETGVRPDGTRVDSFMPTKATGAMNDVEKRALWAYLRSIEPLELGNR
jgi:mono/diheme cytochrome c family protein